MPKIRNTEETFWSFVTKTDKCWLWTKRCFDAHGYGQLRYQMKNWKAHRLSWVFRHGEIPKGMSVLHHCDNPACVRPSHLFLGNQADNLADMRRKGRWQRLNPNPGSTNRASKLTEANVVEIRTRYPAESLRALGREFSVTKRVISLIVRRLAWKHVP